MIAASILVVIAGYLLGAIPVGLLVARWRRGIDIRQFGSGSTGATNILRTLGWQASALVFAGDLAKTMVPVLIAWFLIRSPLVASVTGVAVVAGHCWPVYCQWNGGRGVTSSLAALLILQPLVAVGSLLVAGVVMARSRFVSLGSLAGVAFGAMVMAVLIADRTVPLGDLFFVIGAPLVVFVRHRENILRLLAGTERKIGQKVNSSQKKATTIGPG
ncbi:MAG TPA: glycerol-3-phosphate 1-O-acyltransferase PlsY [Chloroflexota bacterium]|nr:glycerol-3-phosphate 1-O-acyltransferase PlsY [Chloroflexota bacterium]